MLELSPRLSLLPAGKPDPDPMSVLTSSRMRHVIDEAAAKYDWVLIDTRPSGLLPDAHLLAAMVNAVVLVVQANRTPFALVQRAIESLDRNRVIGVVLNLVDDKALSPGGKYGQRTTRPLTTRRKKGPLGPERTVGQPMIRILKRSLTRRSLMLVAG